MSKRKTRKLPAPRDYVAIAAFLHCKGGPMRDRRARRALETRRRMAEE